MKNSLRFAGAAALCAALLLGACAKKTTDQTTASTDSSQTTAAATAAPDAGGSASPDASATVPATVSTGPSVVPTTPATTTTSTTTSSTNGSASGGGYIDLPVYPGATESKEGGMSASTNTGSVAMKVYSTKDDTKKVAEWYKAHLPAAFKNTIMTVAEKTMGTFVDEHTDGDQSVIVADDNGATRIQLTTKHGK